MCSIYQNILQLFLVCFLCRHLPRSHRQFQDRYQDQRDSLRLVHQRSAAFSLAFDRVAGLTSQAFDLFNETLYSFANWFFLPCRGSQHRKEWCGSVLDRGNPAISDRTCSSHISLFHTRRSEPEDMEESSQRQITERKVNLTNFVPPDRVTWWAIDWTALGAMRLFL